MRACTENRSLQALLILTLGIAGCRANVPAAKESFADFVRRLPVAEPGFEYQMEIQDDKHCYMPIASDSAFIPDPWPVLCVLADTTRFYQIIQLFPADDHVPVLLVYNKQGELLDQETVGDEVCAGRDCNTDSCSSQLQFTQFNTIDSRVIIFTTECDAAGDKIAGTLKKEVRVISWSVSEVGEILKDIPDTRKVW
jgi:hypothetical protein